LYAGSAYAEENKKRYIGKKVVNQVIGKGYRNKPLTK